MESEYEKMKIYLVCTLDSEHYREPYFYFFEAAHEAQEWIVNNLSGMNGKRDYKNVDGSKDQIMRIDHSCSNGEFYVHTIHEIEIADGDYICIYHHAYDGVGFYIEKIGTLEECRNQMLDSTARIANDYDIDINDDDVFEVNSFDSCVDDDCQWHMHNIIQFKVGDII